MSGRKKIVLLTIVVLISTLLCITAFGQNSVNNAVSVPEQSKAQATTSRIPAADVTGVAYGGEILAEDELVAKNAGFELYINPDNLILKLKDLSNGYVWSSAPKEESMESLNAEWKKIATSLVMIESFNSSGSVTRSALDYSGDKKPQITKSGNGFSANLDFGNADISLTVNVELKDYGININVPDESIIQEGKNTLHKLYIMPFFGASRGDEIPGYVLIPDGSGALIRFSKPRSYISTFNERVYGYDLGMTRLPAQAARPSQTDRMRLSMPVFGISHGSRQNAFLAVAESGDEYMGIQVNPSGSTVDFTWGCASFIYKDQYVQPTSKSGGGFTTMQPHNNTVNVSMDYVLLSGEDADYVGMAKAYRTKLKDAGMLNHSVDPDSPVKLKIEALMAEPVKGIVGNRMAAMTKFTDVKRWIKELDESGISGLSLVLWGYEKGGVNGRKLDAVKPDRNVGTMNQLKDLRDMVNAQGHELMFRKEIQSGYEKQIDKSRLLNHIDGGVINKTDVSKPMFSTLYYQGLKDMKETLDLFAKNGDVMENLALSGVSTNLFSDFRRNREIYRNETKDKVMELLDTTDESFAALAFYDPNAYTLKYADAVYDVPMQHSQFAYETDTVPFIQIVMSGSVEYYAPHLNFGTNNIDDILKLLDYGAYPSYILTEKYSSELAATNLNYIYSSQYSDWKDKMIETYHYINGILSEVKGKAIEKRTIPVDGIAIVEYEGGTTIAVNYTNEAWDYEGVEVPGKSAKIIE